MKIKNAEVEEIFFQTFSNLTFFYRDATISEDLISKYVVGQILHESGFIDMTYKSGGLASNLRYLIAASNARNLSELNPDAQKFGHVLLSSNAYLKVLDIYKIGNKTQVFLLEISSTAVNFFASYNSALEEDIRKKARNNFEASIPANPVPELQLKEWKDRTELPIGMNNEGEFFYQHRNSVKKPWWKFW